jgi:tRNA threonylcarbamoyladenosine biosynthesis protein TsaE
MSDAVVLWTADEAETRAVGRRVGQVLRGGERIALGGPLGAGKTVVVRGIAEGLGIPAGQVRSPSFPVLLPYSGGRLPLFHVDLFRMPAGDIDSLALREYIYGPGVCAIEWVERLDEPLRDCMEIAIDFAGGDRRRLMATARGGGYDALLDVLRGIARDGLP